MPIRLEMNAIISIFVERGNLELQDRAEILRFGDRTIIVVADGSGGRSGAGLAAEFVVSSTRQNAANLNGLQDCLRMLYELDQKIAKAADCGETTAVIVVLSPDEVSGANVGDSAAWLFTSDGKEELTRVCKPYLGSGVAAPHQFTRKINSGTLVAASDGLWKYTSLESIERAVRAGNPERLATQLADLTRLRSGTFQDDIAIATCRICT